MKVAVMSSGPKDRCSRMGIQRSMGIQRVDNSRKINGNVDSVEKESHSSVIWVLLLDCRMIDVGGKSLPGRCGIGQSEFTTE